ncbi:hypothetical protein LUZ62_020643 [Rhynchospora pubera]|uniref:DUF4408 domain-containing protein n=1 Tax=Rhynchospora pubera TaxID=906938 RepID=A0AAV8GXN8_9POAL|nr:hypothetical protein LUZ62_065904 [Rhynchospora pubera]KAJ4808077.1 hypothetical protein LUZ62_020643 [Rhynchospora pubera]
MVMNKLPPFSQLSKLAFILIFILLTPLVPSSLRPPYLYFLFNILVVSLGIESGLLKAITSPHEEKKPNSIPQAPILYPNIQNGSNVMTRTRSIAAIANQALAKPIEKAKVEIGGIIGVNKLKKCASRPSIFFIGGLESEHECKKENKKENKEEEKEEQWMETEEMTKQELFAKAESFIGNFYRQLKMQREESWKKIHGLYHKAF